MKFDFLKDKLEKNNKKWLSIFLVTIFIITIVLGILIAGFEIQNKNKIYRGVKVGNLSLGGLTKVEAIDLLQQITSGINEEGIKVIYKNDGEMFLEVMPSLGSLTDPDLNREVITFNNHGTIEAAYEIGRGNGWYKNFFEQLKTFFNTKKLEASIEINEILLKEILKQQFTELEKEPQNARPKITWSDTDYNVEIIPEQNGILLNYQKAISQITESLKNLNNETITIEKKVLPAPVDENSARQNKELVDKLMATSTPYLVYENRRWNIGQNDLIDMIEFQLIDGQIQLGLNYNDFEEWADSRVTFYIDREPKNASLELQNGKIIYFVPHQNGRKVNIEKTRQLVNKHLLSDEEKEIEIAVDVAVPETLIGDINDMGIQELIGVGYSNFAGSPNNRRHNIRVGAEALHGILIAPDEEFSLMGALGDIDAENGYLPELVIKGNQTIPEYGGGLCQIGTTAFRVALGTGLPITERRPHAYTVSYYFENGLPGLDATIYVPHPDVRFVNDTGNYILFQTRIEGNELIFEFWGTKDGRKIERSEVSVWDWISPAPTKYVETLDLAVGQKKCTESSHKGVKASFDYIVTYTDGQKKEETFFSQYKPWQAVCLIGVEKLSDTTATSTDSNI